MKVLAYDPASARIRAGDGPWLQFVYLCGRRHGMSRTAAMAAVALRKRDPERELSPQGQAAALERRPPEVRMRAFIAGRNDWRHGRR